MRNVQSKREPKTWNSGMVEKRLMGAGSPIDDEYEEGENGAGGGGGNDARSWTMVERR
jgi:hypothetical protein